MKTFIGYVVFQSTPFARRETTNDGWPGAHGICFNPLPSQEGRHCEDHDEADCDMFQSTPFARRETGGINIMPCYKDVSIHSLRKKGDIGYIKGERQ